MATHEYYFDGLTEAQMDEVAADYPDAFKTIRKPVYSKLAMLCRCGAKLASGKRVAEIVAKDDEVQIPAFLKSEVKG